MKYIFTKGETSVMVHVFIQDSSSSTGAGLAGLDQTSSIVGGYVRQNSVGLALAVDENVVTEGTYAAPTTDNQVRIGTPANMIDGVYELHFHDDLFAAGGPDYVTISLSGAANMAPLLLEIQLTDIDLNTASVPQTADNDTILSSINIANGAVESDLTYIHGTALTETAGQLAAAFKKFFDVAAPTATALSLPDAVPGAAGGGFIAGTNAATVITTSLTTAFTGNLTGDVGGNVDGTVAGKTPSEAGDAMNLAADAIKKVSYDESTAWPLLAADVAATQIARVGADSDTLKTLSDEIAAVKAETASIQTETTALDTLTKAAGDGDLAAILVDTIEIGAAGAGLTNISLPSDALDNIVVSDLAGIPASAAKLVDAIAILFMALRNKQTATSGQQTIGNDAGATIATAVLSDAAGTTTKGEYA